MVYGSRQKVIRMRVVGCWIGSMEREFISIKTVYMKVSSKDLWNMERAEKDLLMGMNTSDNTFKVNRMVRANIYGKMEPFIKVILRMV